MAIDKSIRQHYQTGEKVDPYRKGLEMIAGKGKGAFQTTAPAKITAKSLFQPTGKMTFPSVKASKIAPSIKTLPTITPPSLDSARYSGLVNILPKTEEGSYLDKYINRKPVRIVERAAKPTVEDTAAMEDIGIGSDYLTSSLVGTDKATTSLDINNILAPLAQISNEGATAFSDNQIENIFKSENEETKNFITSTIGTVNDIIKDNPLLETGTDFIINTTLKNTVAKQLGIGSMFGPLGMLFSWAFDKVVSKIKGEEPKGPIHTLIDKATSKDKDKEFKVSGTYGGNEVYSSDGSSVDSETGDITNADGSHGGNIVDEFPSEPSKSAPKPVVTYTPPVRHHTGGNGGGGNGGGGKGSSPSDAPGSPFLRGGRVDKALGGRSRDI